MVEIAPGHVAEVRRLVFDALTKAQQRQLHAIGRRIVSAIDPDDPSLDDEPFRSADQARNCD